MAMGQFQLEKAMSLLVLLVTLGLPTLSASFYASYRDVFGQMSGPMNGEKA
jgi:hypothetical protein